MSHWEHFHHQADIGIRGCGNELATAFEQAAIGLTAVITDPNGVSAIERIEIQCRADDRELLFVDWLNALIYAMATRKMLFSRFQVHLFGSELQATAWGERIDPPRHQPCVEIKGATYTELCVDKLESTWIAQCVVDV